MTLLAAVRSAFGADAMGDVIFAAAFAFDQMVQGQGIMRAPTIAPRFRDFPSLEGAPSSYSCFSSWMSGIIGALYC